LLSIGDASLKDYPDQPEKCAVTCIPEVKCLELDPEKHLYLVIACDGIWDVFTNEEIGVIVAGELGDTKKTVSPSTLNSVAGLIVNRALDRGSMDNCTAVVVAL